jgi:hypothetical protein
VLYSTLRQYLCLLQRVEDLLVQELIAQLPVETLTVPVLPRSTGRDVQGPRAQLAPPLPQLLGNELPLSERMCSGIPRTNITSANVSPNPEAQDRANRDDAAADRGKHRERNYPTSLQGSQPSAEPMSDGFRRSFSTFTRNDAVTRRRGKCDGGPVGTPYNGPMSLTRTDGKRGPNSHRATRAGTPAVQLVHFRVLGPPFCGAERRAGAMGWGRSLSKFGPSIKMMQSPWVSRACVGAAVASAECTK